MRIALLSDIHGNRHALDAVLADAAAIGVDATWALGDLIAAGPEPIAVLERLVGLAGFAAVRGNTDRYVVTGDGPRPTLEHARANVDLVHLHARVTASFAWTRGYVTAHGWYDWLAELPLEQRLELPDGSRLLGVHARPETDDGSGIHPGHSDAEISEKIAGCEADIVCVGHTHQAMVRDVDGTRVVNLGCVGNPLAPDLRASYVILEATKSGTEIRHRRVAYDHDAFIETVHESHHPETPYILSFQQGHHRERVVHPDQLPQ